MTRYLINRPADSIAAAFEAKRQFIAGQAAGFLLKAGAAPEPVYALTGRLYVSSSGWGLLSVPNAMVRGLFDAIHEPGYELPLRDGKLEAHISVFTSDEIDKIGGPEKLTERGHQYRYQLGRLEKVKPAGWDDMSSVMFVTVESPELKALRKSYGLTPLPHGDHPFHVTVCCRRKHVLRDGPVSKAAATDRLPGGLADGRPDSDFDAGELAQGREHEGEHTDDPEIAGEIAKDHLAEDPRYYDELAAFEGEEKGAFALAVAGLDDLLRGAEF